MDANREIAELTEQIEALKKQLSEARRRREPEPVADYELTGSDGRAVLLSALFGDKNDLILVHNMGRGCSYCTMWADGFVSALPHLQDRTAFVVCSPDTPEIQTAFAKSRGWSFPLVSGADSSFIKDMGFQQDEGYWPGVSAFHKDAAGNITRTGQDVFGPGDDYCSPWRFFDLLSGGAGDWEPQYKY